MEYEIFKSTTVGNDYLKTLQKNEDLIPVDGYLEYIIQVENLRKSCPDNPIWEEKFDREIQATKRIIKKII